MESESSWVRVKALKEIPRYKPSNGSLLGTRRIKLGDVLSMSRSTYRMYRSLGAVKLFELEVVGDD